MKILVTRVDHLGDVILTTPLVRALAMAGHEVHVLVPGSFVPVFEHSPRVAGAWAMDAVAPGFPKNWRVLAGWMRHQRFDAILLPYALRKQLLWASFFSGAKTRIAMWGGIWGRLTFHRCLSSRIHEQPRYFADIILDCARAMGIPLQGSYPEMFLTDKEISRGEEELARRFGDRKLIGIHPGCAGSSCNLPPSAYEEIARSLLSRSEYGIVLTGTKQERTLIAGWSADVLSSPKVWASMGELTLRELAAVIRRLSAYICPSTGPLHIASALGVPTVSPFCTVKTISSVVWGNQRANAFVAAPAPEFCRSRRGGAHRHCDFCGQLSSEMLAEAALRLAGADSGARH